jgi:hypothetical protein
MGAQPLRSGVPEERAVSSGARRPAGERPQARDAEALPVSPDAMGDRNSRHLEKKRAESVGGHQPPSIDQPSIFKSAGQAPVLASEIRNLSSFLKNVKKD